MKDKFTELDIDNFVQGDRVSIGDFECITKEKMLELLSNYIKDKESEINSATRLYKRLLLSKKAYEIQNMRGSIEEFFNLQRNWKYPVK